MTNTTPTELQARISDETVQKMVDLIKHLAMRKPNENNSVCVYDARAIVAELPKPVDPDVLAVREILAAIATMAHGYIRGDYDRTPEFEKALATYKRLKADRA